MIEIELSAKSIKQAIRHFKKAETEITGGRLMKAFLNKCYTRIIQMINLNIDSLQGYSSEIKEKIKGGWNKEIVGDTLIVTNTSDKAVFLEFGVGLIGESSPHPEAANEGYEYNIPTEHKDSDGYWRFYVWADMGDIDIQRKNYTIDKSLWRGQRLVIKTKGNEAQLYTYNALMDFVMNHEGQKIWNGLLGN